MDCKFCAGKQPGSRFTQPRAPRYFLNPLLELFRLSNFHRHLFAHPRDSIDQYLYDLHGEEAVLQRTGGTSDLLSTLLGWDSSLRAQRKIRPFHFHGRIIGAGNPWLLVLGMVWLLLGFREPRFSCGSFSASLSTPGCTTAWSVMTGFTVCFKWGQPMSPVGSFTRPERRRSEMVCSLLCPA